MSHRRKIRETVMQAIYAQFVGGQPLEHVLQTIIKPEFRDDDLGLDFAERLLLRAADNRSRIDDIIRDHIANWKIDRLAIVDRVILQMAITEILTFEDIPTKVTINEAIEIAKKYSTARSGRFVNGILDAVVITLQQDGALQKRGRGLVDQPARRKKTNETEDTESDGDTDEAPITPVERVTLKPSPDAVDPDKIIPKKRRIKRSEKKKDQ